MQVCVCVWRRSCLSPALAETTAHKKDDEKTEAAQPEVTEKQATAQFLLSRLKCQWYFYLIKNAQKHNRQYQGRDRR